MAKRFILLLFVLFSAISVNAADFGVKDVTTDDFQLDCLLIHNELRENHCSPQIKYSPKLKLFATRRATALAKSDGKIFGHIKDSVFGENIFRYKTDNLTKIDCKTSVEHWYREKVRYNRKSGPNSHSRHFAQVVWSSSERIGCSSVASLGPIGDVFIVCNYYNTDKFGLKSSQNVMSVQKCDQKLSNRRFKYKELTNGQWLQECIQEHNRIRKIHSVDPLTIDDAIFQSSQKRALEMARKGFRFFRHKRSDFGENIHWTKADNTDGQHSMSCNTSIDKWYHEIYNYNWESRARHNGTVRHFIQLVWKSTLTVGCAQVQNIEEPKGGVYTVCLYQPKADTQDIELQWDNVFPEYNRPTASSAVTDVIPNDHEYEHIDELDDETELEKEFRDVDEVIDPRIEYQRQTPALSLEDMFIKTTTEYTGLSNGFDRNEYNAKRHKV